MKTRTLSLVLGAIAALSCGLQAGAQTTYVNPIDVNYLLLPVRNGSPADPEIILHDGKYWLFGTNAGGYFVSDDLAHWKWIADPQLPTTEWAPTVEEINGKLHFSSRMGTILRAVDLLKGKWEKLPQKVPGSVDSAFFADGNRLFLYWGGGPACLRGKASPAPIVGCEIDPKTFAAKTRPKSLFTADMARYGWEVGGDNNDNFGRFAYLEGAHMFRRGERYYLQYAASGTEFASYCDTALIGSSPLGPFRRQRMNPFSYKNTGYIPSAGHGKTFADRYGNVWHITTGLLLDRNRRFVMFPVFFDTDGEMWCDTAFGDWPFVVPDHKVSSPEELRTGWMELAEGKKTTASSTADGYPATAAVDGRILTYWSAATGNVGESFAVDFGGLATVRAVQIGFGGLVRFRSFRIEAQMTDGSWRTVVEEKSHRPCAEHPYYPFEKPFQAKALRIVNTEKLANGERFALRELRAFGSMEKQKPAAPQGFRVVRDAADRRHATVSWQPVADARGYLIRYGISKEKMHLSRVEKGCMAEIRSLDAAENYVWTVTAYNEAGFGAGTEPAEKPCDVSNLEQALRAVAPTALPIDLSGEWACTGTNFTGKVRLPGTLAEAGLGVLQTPAHFAAYTERSAKTSLARRRQYHGPATYVRRFTLTAADAAKPLEVFLERVMWASRVKIDGRDFGLCDSLGTPHVHAIPAGTLAAGKHLLEIEIDNSRRYGMIQHAHGWSEWMQSIWHGAIGRLEIREANPLRSVRVFAEGPANGKVRFELPKGFVPSAKTVTSDDLIFTGFTSVPSPYAEGRVLVTASLASEPQVWDEFNPRLYRVTFHDAASGFTQTVRLGFRTISRKGNRLFLNGRSLFVRADIDNCGFPLTGHPAMDKREWRRIISIEKHNGLNAIQLHTWTPPAAAFEVADEEGVMIFCELGYWEGSAGHGNLAVDDYVRRELKAVSDAYGNAPSMVATSYGNELGKCNFKALDEWMVAHKRYDPRRITMCSTARTVAPSDDFMVTHHYPGLGATRGKHMGSTAYDYEDVYRRAPIPVIAHEIGQWPVYPVWDEQIPKFHGLLVPWRWPPLREAAISNNTFRFAREFHSASMQSSRHFYKLETEGFLRTPSCAGVDFLDVRDYTGQGEALVGWFDAFFDAKPALGEVAPWSEVMRPVMFLARFNRFIWTPSDGFAADLMVRNALATEIPAGTRWRWSLGPREGWVTTEKAIAPGELATVGRVTMPLFPFAAPQRYEFRFGENRWRLYVLPELPAEEPLPAGVVRTADPSVAAAALAKGGRVLYTGRGVNSDTTWFTPIYWSTGLFPARHAHVGLGAVIDADHPALAPTGCDTWQDEFWRSLFTPNESRWEQSAFSYRLRDMPADYRPLVTVVPDLHHSFFISPLFEVCVGEGRLLACGLKIDADTPSARLLRRSLYRYLASEDFKPKAKMTMDWFDQSFRGKKASAPAVKKMDKFVEDMRNL